MSSETLFRCFRLIAAVGFCVTVTTTTFGGCSLKVADAPVVTCGADEEPNGPSVIPGEYVVTFQEPIDAATIDQIMTLVDQEGGQIIQRYAQSPTGFAAAMSDDLVGALRRLPSIGCIERNHRLSATGVQTCAPWNLDRTDQKSNVLDGAYGYDATGQGVDVYILDSGIRQNHAAFGGAASRVVDGVCTSTANGACPVPNVDPALWNDCHGHGTALAGIVGGGAVLQPDGVPTNDFGVAKGVTLHAVRVANCPAVGQPSTTTADLKAGLAWMRLNHPDGQPAVALIGYAIPTVAQESTADEIEGAIEEGIIVVVSAGNDGASACGYSPGGAYPDPVWAGWQWGTTNRALTVGAVQEDGQLWSSSNTGNCVDLVAPGVNVETASLKTCDKVNFMTGCSSFNTVDGGTSYAAAHVAGVAALLWEKSPNATADSLINEIIADSQLSSGTLFSSSQTGSPDPGSASGGCADGVPACAGPGCYFCPAGGRCCNGIACGRGLLCNDGNCTTCGGEGEPCCLGQDCGVVLSCDVNTGTCECGGFGQKCCGGMNGTCDGQLECVGDTCGECGEESQPCCNGTCKGADLDCDASDNCVHCGFDTEPCCDGTCILDGLQCNPASQKCAPCGDVAEPCCAGACFGADLSCVSNQCQACGNVNQQCCAGACFGADLSCVSNQCQTCGQVGQECCAGACFGADLSCVSNQCQACGNVNQECCAGACFGADLSCVSNQCQACGHANQDCCAGECAAVNLTCFNGKCATCGDATQDCCSGMCNGDDLVCKSGKCEACGSDNLKCCAFATCDGQDLACVLGNCQTCGAVGQPCCGAQCGTGMQCSGGLCASGCNSLSGNVRRVLFDLTCSGGGGAQSFSLNQPLDCGSYLAFPSILHIPSVDNDAAFWLSWDQDAATLTGDCWSAGGLVSGYVTLIPVPSPGVGQFTGHGFMLNTSAECSVLSFPSPAWDSAAYPNSQELVGVTNFELPGGDHNDDSQYWVGHYGGPVEAWFNGDAGGGDKFWGRFHRLSYASSVINSGEACVCGNGMTSTFQVQKPTAVPNAKYVALVSVYAFFSSQGEGMPDACSCDTPPLSCTGDTSDSHGYDIDVLGENDPSEDHVTIVVQQWGNSWSRLGVKAVVLGY